MSISMVFHKMNLYRRTCFRASMAVLLAALVFTLKAASFQRSIPHKLRAIGLLEVITEPSGTIKTRLIPITILANGRFHDASIYESRPRPMALGSGVVYEAQKTGTPVGYMTVGGASNTMHGWEAEGKWQTVNQVQAAAKPKPTAPPPTPTDERPILHREGDNPQPSAPPSDQTQSPPSDDRPVIHRSGDSNQQSSTPAGQSSGQSTTTQSTQPDTSGPPPEDPNRPVLRRRTGSSDDDADKPATPSPAKPSTPATRPLTVVTPQPPVITPGVETFIAVSDAQASDSRSYEYHWKPEEKERVEAKMRKLALLQLPNENSQLNEHALTNVVIRSFDLDLSNDAVVVITAEVPGGYLAPAKTGATGKTPPAKKTPAATSAATTPPPASDKFVSRYVTVIARVDIDGNPQKLAASVTDSSRLDVAPRLELIDAVDVDGDGLAELLFREYDFDQKSFLVYGVGHGTVTKVFEGASVPLK